MTQTQVRRPEPQKRDEAPADVPVTDTTQELKDRMDDLLDEVDEVLEENAEEFVKAYVQKGGQ